MATDHICAEMTHMTLTTPRRGNLARRGVVACGAATRGRGARRRRPLIEETLGISPLNVIIYNPQTSNMMKNGDPIEGEGQGGLVPVEEPSEVGGGGPASAGSTAGDGGCFSRSRAHPR